MPDLPSDLSAMLEAVEKYMGEQFTEMLADEIDLLIEDAAWSATVAAVAQLRS